MKPLLFVGDSHLARLEKAHSKSDLPDAVFFCTSGPISNLVEFSDGKLGLKEDRHYLSNRAQIQTQTHDFVSWLDLTMGRLNEIEASTGVDVSGYSAVVIVSYQLFNPEVWVEAALAHVRGEISSRVWKMYSETCLTLNHARSKSVHFKLLDQINQISDPPKIYSVATPARCAESEFPKNLLRDGETGHQALELAETRYAELIRERYRSDFIAYPDTLLSDDGLCTADRFQSKKGDFTHVNIEGSRLWLDSIFAHIRNADAVTN